MTLLIGIAVGLVLGLTGAGGSILAVPLLMWTLDWSLPQAAPVALLAVCAAATAGAVAAWRRAYVRYRAGLLMGVLGVATAPLGLALAQRAPHAVLELLFAAVMIVVAARLLRRAQVAPDEARIVRATVAGEGVHAARPLCRLNPATGRIRWTVPCGAVLALIGAATGFLSGLLGVGGGFVVVPALRAFTELSLQSAVATSLMVIAITSGGAVAGYVAGGGALPLAAALPFVAGALAGMAAGRFVAPRIAGPGLQQAFALTMLLAAAILAARTILQAH